MSKLHAATSRNLGFTLIELSIVLVIIGLVLGGVLAGRDLVNAATLRAQVSQIQQYITATNTFNLKYSGLPGDLNATLAAQDGFDTAGGCLGPASGDFAPSDPNQIVRNGDGLIGSVENNLYFLDLSQAQMINYAITPATFTAAGIADPCNPINHYISPPGIIAGNVLGIAYTDYASSWFLLNGGALYNGMSSLVTITPIQAYGIDAKIDDGLPVTGNVRAELFSENGGEAGIWNGADMLWSAPTDGPTSVPPYTTCFNTTSYNYSTSYQKGGLPSCLLSIKMQ